MKTQNMIIYQILLLGLFLVFASSCENADDDDNNTPNTFTDPRDGNVYQIVTIGDQVWMAENLRYLPSVVGPGTGSDTIPYFYVYGYDGTSVIEAKTTANYDAYGVLYNWAAAMNGSSSSTANPSGVQGVCPPGWHLPSDAEWMQLIDHVVSLGFPNSDVTNGAGNALKSCRQIDSPLDGDCNTAAHPRWEKDSYSGLNHHGFDALGFSAFPGGGRHNNGVFFSIGGLDVWWSATSHSSTNAWIQEVYYGYGMTQSMNSNKEKGFSIRCVRD